MFDDARNLAAEVGVSSEEMNRVPRGTNSRSVYRPNAGHGDQDSTTYYQSNVFFPLLDAILQDLQLRFGPHHQKIAGLSRLVPSFLGRSTWSDIVPAFEKYAEFLDSVNVVKVCLFLRLLYTSYIHWRLYQSLIRNYLKTVETLTRTKILVYRLSSRKLSIAELSLLSAQFCDIIGRI